MKVSFFNILNYGSFLKVIIFLGLLLKVIILTGCRQAPTKVIEESVDQIEQQIVLLDTRSALDFASFHILGSRHLFVEDFLILKSKVNSHQKNYQLDPNLNDIIERLAHKGMHPNLKVYLIGDIKNSIANKKWRWLLSYLEIAHVNLFSIDEIKKMKTGRFKEAQIQKPWVLKSSIEFQNEFIYKKAAVCFVKWSDINCL